MYCQILEKTTNGVKVRDNYGKEFEIRGVELLEKTFKSASQFEKTEKVTVTKLAEILVELGDQVFTCEFVKQDGSNRTLTGYKLSTENLMGRVNAVDLTISGYNNRQIDLRTLKSLVVNNTKYVIK